MATNAVLEFILGLLRDDEAAANYCANPTAALDAAGLCDVSPADIVAVAPLVAESGLFAGGGADLSAIVNAGASRCRCNRRRSRTRRWSRWWTHRWSRWVASAAAWVSAPVQESESEAPSAASSTWSATSQQPSALRLPSVARSVPNSAQPSAL